LHPHLTAYSASTTPIIPCLNVFPEVVADGKPRSEPEWEQGAGGPQLKKKNNPQIQGDTLTGSAHRKDKQRDLNSFDDDDERVYQSEQEFGHFSTTGPTTTFGVAGEEDSWREYRNMMYYSTNCSPPYSTGGGGESSRSNSRRSSIFAPSPSPPIPVSTGIHIAPAEKSGESEVEEQFWPHFYSLDALQFTICQRLFTASLNQQNRYQQGRQLHSHKCIRDMSRHKQLRATRQKVRYQSRRLALARRGSTASVPPERTANTSSSPRRGPARTARHQSLA
jgi:hypothetical protein